MARKGSTSEHLLVCFFVFGEKRCVSGSETANIYYFKFVGKTRWINRTFFFVWKTGKLSSCLLR
jgi:hypothetical protein